MLYYALDVFVLWQIYVGSRSQIDTYRMRASAKLSSKLIILRAMRRCLSIKLNFGKIRNKMMQFGLDTEIAEIIDEEESVAQSQ